MDQITVQPMRAVKAGVSRIVKNKLKIDMTPMVAVDALDEMTINGVTRYAIVKPDLPDLKWLEKNE